MAEQRQTVAVNRYLLNKDIHDPYGRLRHFKGDGWENMSIKLSSLKSILVDHGFGIQGVEFGDDRWHDTGYQRVVRENIKQVTLIGLDFDNFEDRPSEGTSIDDAFHDSILSTAALGYTSSSHPNKPQDKFRLMWWLEEPMSAQEAEVLLRKMILLWEGVDDQCSNPNRTWFGHKDGDIIFNNPGSCLPVDEINDRWDVEGDDLLLAKSAAEYGGGLSITGGEYVIGLHDTFCDEIGLAIECLRWIPKRGPSGSFSYKQSIKVIMGLARHFGELALDIIDQADWEGDHWDIRKDQWRAAYTAAQRNDGDRKSTFGSVIKLAKVHGMPDKTHAQFWKRGKATD